MEWRLQVKEEEREGGVGKKDLGTLSGTCELADLPSAPMFGNLPCTGCRSTCQGTVIHEKGIFPWLQLYICSPSEMIRMTFTQYNQVINNENIKNLESESQSPFALKKHRFNHFISTERETNRYGERVKGTKSHSKLGRNCISCSTSSLPTFSPHFLPTEGSPHLLQPLKIPLFIFELDHAESAVVQPRRPRLIDYIVHDFFQARIFFEWVFAQVDL